MQCQGEAGESRAVRAAEGVSDPDRQLWGGGGIGRHRPSPSLSPHYQGRPSRWPAQELEGEACPEIKVAREVPVTLREEGRAFWSRWHQDVPMLGRSLETAGHRPWFTPGPAEAQRQRLQCAGRRGSGPGSWDVVEGGLGFPREGSGPGWDGMALWRTGGGHSTCRSGGEASVPENTFRWDSGGLLWGEWPSQREEDTPTEAVAAPPSWPRRRWGAQTSMQREPPSPAPVPRDFTRGLFLRPQAAGPLTPRRNRMTRGACVLRGSLCPLPHRAGASAGSCCLCC